MLLWLQAPGVIAVKEHSLSLLALHCSVLLCCAVPIEPQNVEVTPVSGSELSVSWTAPDQPPNAPPVLYYTVSWKEGGGEGGSHNISGHADTMYQITGLAQGTQYTVTVTAHNSVGRSDPATGSGTTFSGEWSTRCACSS